MTVRNALSANGFADSQTILEIIIFWVTELHHRKRDRGEYFLFMTQTVFLTVSLTLFSFIGIECNLEWLKGYYVEGNIRSSFTYQTLLLLRELQLYVVFPIHDAHA